MKKIVTLTMNPTIDKSAVVDYVVPENKLRCGPPYRHPGGGGINVSRAVHQMGGESLMVYPAGGQLGELLSQLLDEEGLAYHAIPIDGMTRENFTIFENSTTKQYRFGMPGPELSEEEWQRCLSTILDQEADYLVVSGSLPPGVPEDFYGQLAKQATKNGMRVIVDTSGKALHEAAKCGVFLLKPNLRELEIFYATEIHDESHLKETARQMIAHGMAEVIAVSMGAAGAVFITADEFAHLRAPLVPIRSKVGAGDSMVGGIVLALARDDSLLDAVRYGVAAGTAAVMTPGTELCRGADVEELFSQVTVTV